MAEARNPGLLRYRTFRPEPGRAAPPEPPAEFLALGTAQASARLPRAVGAASAFPALRRAPLLREALAFFLALVFPLLSALVCLFASFCVRFLFRGVSSSPISVWAWACGAALISVKHRVLASRPALDLVFSPLRLLILLLEWRWPLRLASQTFDASSLICLLLSLRRGSEIFLASERAWGVSHFAQLRRENFFVLH